MTATLATAGYGTLLKRGDGGTKASLVTDNGTAAKKITWQARETGVVGEDITIAMTATGTVATTSVAVTGTDIVVTLRSSSGTGLATAKEVVQAIRASVAASALVKVTLGGDGTGAVTAAAEAPLDGGVDELYTSVAEITSLSGPSESMDTIEATHMTSPGARREFIASLLDSGEVSGEMNFLPGDANQQGFRNDLNSRIRRRWQIVYTDESLTTYEFDAFVTSNEPSANVDDKLTASFTLKVTGEVEKLV
jgi:hypothetical protein